MDRHGRYRTDDGRREMNSISFFFFSISFHCHGDPHVVKGKGGERGRAALSINSCHLWRKHYAPELPNTGFLGG